MYDDTKTFTAFLGSRRLATGTLAEVAGHARRELSDEDIGALLIFDDQTGRGIDVDMRGTVADVMGRLAPAEAKRQGPGRPKLGVVSREISLLPRHWEWLATQSGGASVTLRRLVDEARKAGGGRDRVRQAQAAAYGFMNAMAGNLTGFEEALRALYAGDAKTFEALVRPWPKDVRDHLHLLARPAFQAERT